MIIKLPYGPTKFKSTSIKPYFINRTSINNNQPLPESSVPTPTQTSAIETSTTEKDSAEVPLTEGIPIYATAISTPLVSFATVKLGCRQPRKLPEQLNFMSQSDICFVMDEFDMFINKDADAQDTASGQKEIAGILEKEIFKVVSFENVPSNTQIFNSRFVDKIQNPSNNKAYEKSRLVI